MPGLSKVIVVLPDSGPDARAGRQLRLGFAREGVPSEVAQLPGEGARLDLPAGDTGLVVVGGTDGRSLDLLRRTRFFLDEAKLNAPILFTGRGVRRVDAEAAGADEVVLLPAYLRDVVTIGRLLRTQPATQRHHLVGNLAETTGVYTLVRALAALGRSAVLTLMRGLRRGEIRFFHGEVTSAQVGLIHGQAALHQLLLWTEARFEFQHEDVVRRQQIPLTHAELFADADRFLEGVRDSSGALSPSMVLEQDLPRIYSLGKQIPTEVHGVLRMFDGHRVLADVLEDSPYRVFETLRVAQRACDVGLLRPIQNQRPKATWRAVLAIEEWLVGSESPSVIDRSQPGAAAPADTTGPVLRESQSKIKGGRRKRRKQRANTPLAVQVTTSGSRPDIDWGALVPRTVGAEVGSLSGVVPAAQLSGEIQLPTREAPREKLESLMDTDKRTRIFPTDIGLEPKVVFDEGEDVARANRERALAVDRARAEAAARELAAKQVRDREDAETRAKADAAANVAAAAKAKADAELAAEAKAKADAQARAKIAADAKAKAAAEAKAAFDAKLAAEVKAKADAAARAKAELEEKAQAAEAEARAVADAKAKAAAGAKMRADAEARARAEQDAKKKAEVAEHLRRKREEAEAAEDAKLRAEAAEWAKQQAAARARAADEQAREAEELATRLANVKATAETEARSSEDAMWKEAEERARKLADEEAAAKASLASQLVKQLRDDSNDETTPFVRDTIETPPVIVAETPTATVVVHDTLTVTGTDRTAILTSTSTATIIEAAVDEPSDGIVQPLTTLETAPLRPPPPPVVVPPDDRPEAKVGEISGGVNAQGVDPRSSEPSILVADLATAHTAVAAVAIAQVSAPATADAATVSREIVVADVRKDAASAFSEAEEAFFRAGTEKAAPGAPMVNTAPIEKFDDLDADYQPVGFWDRLRGKKPTK